jgi:hypothetical protein
MWARRENVAGREHGGVVFGCGVAAKAKAAGGDAVIRTGDFEQYVATVSSATGNAYTTVNANFVGNTAQFNANTTASGTGQCPDFLAQQPVPSDQIPQLKI